MKRYLTLTLFVLAIMALAVVSLDYVCGHMGENPLSHNTCPLCHAFGSFEPGLLFLAIVLILNPAPIRRATASVRSDGTQTLCGEPFSPRPPPTW